MTFAWPLSKIQLTFKRAVLDFFSTAKRFFRVGLRNDGDVVFGPRFERVRRLHAPGGGKGASARPEGTEANAEPGSTRSRIREVPKSPPQRKGETGNDN